jgi:hypothetical protein
MPDLNARTMFPDALTDARAPAIAKALIEGFNRHYTLFRQPRGPAALRRSRLARPAGRTTRAHRVL